ncbi:cyclin-T1-5-like isoform X2 [Diospyros lotus]|nr:cyclin-T1-5-like isoform X2 [Diospyros lotus]XP_052174183.1 cyclin-T1-5-like isoform X2 [Diospyros lotus]
MFLAGKVEETPRPLKDVILVSYEIIHKKDPTAVQRIKQKEVYEQQKELILLGERVVLGTLGFDLNVHHPYKPLVEAIKKFKVAQNALAQVAWNFVNDGLRTSLCLQFKPHHIAAGAIFLAAKFLKVKLPYDGEKVWWQEFDVTPRQLEEVSNQMLELYEQNRAPPSQASEVEGSGGAGISHRPPPKAPTGNEEHATNNSNSQDGDTTSKPGTLKPASSRPVPDHSYTENHSGPPKVTQNRSNDYGSAEVKSVSEHRGDGEVVNQHHGSEQSLYEENMGEVQNSYRIGSGLGEEDRERNVVRSEARGEGEFKDRYHGRHPDYRDGTVGQSPQDAIKKIDKDKVKAALEKRKKSRGDIARRTDLIDEDDLIERELEDGIELAAESDKMKRERRQSWSKSSNCTDHGSPNHGKHQDDAGDGHRVGTREQSSSLHGQDFENVEEGEVAAFDDAGHGYRSPKSSSSSSRKRRAGSPADRALEGKQRYEFPEDRNKLARLGHSERDQKRQYLQENHV